MRWQRSQPCDGRHHCHLGTRWHLAQLAAYQKEWEAALTHLQAVEEQAVLGSAEYKEAVGEAQKRVREAMPAKLASEEKKG